MAHITERVAMADLLRHIRTFTCSVLPPSHAHELHIYIYICVCVNIYIYIYICAQTLLIVFVHSHAPSKDWSAPCHAHGGSSAVPPITQS